MPLRKGIGFCQQSGKSQIVTFLFYIYFLISTTDTFITKATDFLSIVLERRSIIFLICFLQHPFFVSQKISHPRFSMCMSYTFYDYQLNSH